MNPLILALATARLTQLVVDDAITEPIRDKIAERPEGETWSAVLDEVINCHACTSVWAGGGVLLASSSGRVGRFLTHVLALSQAALAVKSVIERIDR